MNLHVGQFYKLARDALVGFYYTDPFGAFPRHYSLPKGTILYLVEIKYYQRPCGHHRYARFTLSNNDREISIYVNVGKSNEPVVAGLLTAHPLEALADAADSSSS